MDKYFIFREMLNFMADHADVIDADMNYCGSVMIEGEDDEHTIRIEISVKDKEVKKDD